MDLMISKSRLGLFNNTQVLDQCEAEIIIFMDDVKMGPNFLEKFLH